MHVLTEALQKFKSPILQNVMRKFPPSLLLCVISFPSSVLQPISPCTLQTHTLQAREAESGVLPTWYGTLFWGQMDVWQEAELASVEQLYSGGREDFFATPPVCMPSSQ